MSNIGQTVVSDGLFNLTMYKGEDFYVACRWHDDAMGGFYPLSYLFTGTLYGSETNKTDDQLLNVTLCDQLNPTEWGGFGMHLTAAQVCALTLSSGYYEVIAVDPATMATERVLWGNFEVKPGVMGC
jgi:hypothetical protein